LGRIPVRSDLHVFPGLGHSFEAGSKAMSEEVLQEVVRVILAWMDSL
jgi:hypothetical protein